LKALERKIESAGKCPENEETDGRDE
jgi:hypothetical protein